MANEADTCRKYILPKLIDSGWDNDPHSFTEQGTFTDGRIIVSGGKVHRRPQKWDDYLLRYTRDFPIAMSNVLLYLLFRSGAAVASAWGHSAGLMAVEVAGSEGKRSLYVRRL